MQNIQDLPRNETSEKLVDILCHKTQNNNDRFFRVLVAYYFSKIASMMRCNIQTMDRGIIPVNTYVLNLATSGSGKGLSMNLMEDQVILPFRETYLEHVFPQISEKSLADLSQKRSVKKNSDPDEEIELVHKEFERLGPLVFSFDSGTTPAVKQMRQKLLMAGAGSMNLEIDEIGSNLLGNMEVLETFLELYDVGKVKQKLIKNTNDNLRSEEIEGRTPTNLMMFGTPVKLLNGGKVEEEFYSMLEAGYARRCLFSYNRESIKRQKQTPEEVLDILTSTDTEQFLSELSAHIEQLADMTRYKQKLYVSREVTLIYIKYKLDCELKASNLPEHEDIRKSEMSHRYFKALKLAGAYAFVDGHSEISKEHLYSAIRVVEESAQDFNSLLTRDRNYVKLAKYISTIGREITHVDLMEDLPFYKGSASARADLIQLATTWGYRNHIIIKKIFDDGIEFLRGETLEQTKLDKLILSHGVGMAQGYSNDYAKFDKLSNMTQLDNYNWINHHLKYGDTGDGHRKDDNVIMGFNMAVLDIDSGISLEQAQILLKDYTYHIHTTKSHTDTHHRFRVLLPMSHVLKLTQPEYREFMQNLYDWLPFDVDDQTHDRVRKWTTADGEHFSNSGQLIDVRQFIPKTAKNDEFKKSIEGLRSLDNLERWFIHNTGEGNRNKQLLRFAMMLADTGESIQSVQSRVLSLNEKLPNKLDESEILTTIMVSVTRHISKRDASAP